MKDTAQDSRFAAEHSADVDVEKIAGVYAHAYLNAAADQKVPAEEAVEEFASLVEILNLQTKFADVLFSTMISVEEKVRLLEKTVAVQATPLFWNFLQVLARRRRLDILVPIYFQVKKIFDKQSGRVPVVITTSAEIDESLFNSLTEKLRSVLGGDPVIKVVIDPETIGGIMVRVGDTIYDASIQTQLKNIRSQMIERSAREIQSRKNDF
ncbi:ATP synthase subunit delta [Planctomycetales bacterium]|nr:ATP synthase subunit delta [Planctomycetales bacterium]